MKKMTRTRSKYSAFCQKKPTLKPIKIVAVYIKEPHKMWIVCLGKLHMNGNCRYWYNGIEGVSGPFNYKDLTGLTDEQVYHQMVRLNISQLENLHPRNKQVSPMPEWYAAVGYAEPPVARPRIRRFSRRPVNELLEQYRDRIVVLEEDAIEVANATAEMVINPPHEVVRENEPGADRAND